MTGHQISLGKGWRIDKHGKLRPPPPRDASAAKRERPGGSKRVRVKRKGA